MAERIFESFSIACEDGATWSGYQTEVEAQEVILHAIRKGQVVRKTWTVNLDAGPDPRRRKGIRDDPTTKGLTQ